jgi:polysaccharide pyruvyl transferase WcaK-like protein
VDRKKAAVLGFYDHGNCGDEAYKVAFPLLFPNYDFLFADTVEKIESLRPDLLDCVVVGGGDIVHKNFLEGIYEIRCRTPLYALSVTVTDQSDLDNLQNFNQVVVRDRKSLLTATPYSNNAFYLPDFTFALTPVASSGRKILEEKFEQNGKILTDDFVVCVLNSYISFNDYKAPARDVLAFNNLCYHLAELCEKSSLSWVFLPFSTQSPWDDRATSAWLCNRCKKRYEKNLVVYDRLTPQDTLDIIAASRTIISTRLHSTIFSVISGVPFVDIVHHDKNSGFIETLGMNFLSTNFWKYDWHKVELDLRLYTEIEENLYYEDIKGKLKNFTENAKSELNSAAPLLLP